MTDRRRRPWAGLLLSAVLASMTLTTSPAAAAPEDGVVRVVQAVPGKTVDVVIDGETVHRSVAAREVLGPMTLPAGQHTVFFSAKGGGTMQATFRVGAGENIDVVLHRPASPTGKDMVSVYTTPLSPIGAGKARVFVAHTALVPPADVIVDGTTVFSNIANGEFATADVPAGEHSVMLTQTGTTTDPLLGPLEVTLDPQTVTVVYAVGSPTDGSMDVITHTLGLESDGSVAPQEIRTGDAGLAADQAVTAFGSPARDGSGGSAQPDGGGSTPWLPIGLTGFLAVLLGTRWRVDASRQPR